MEETYQLTSALKHLSFGKYVSLITDARFSGVSTGACIGHVGPEALAGGPIGKLRNGDLIDIVVDRNTLEGSINFVGAGKSRFHRRKALSSWHKGPSIRICALTKLCRMTPGCGQRCSPSAEGHGEGMCTMWSGS